MNCRDAREQLDAARPPFFDPNRAADGTGAPPFGTEKGASATRHVADCVECRDVIRGRVQFDRNVATVMRDVAIPVGLKSRILDALRVAAGAETAVLPESPIEASPRGGQRTRRWIMAATGTVAAVLLTALAVRYYWPAERQPEALPTLAELRQGATLSESRLNELDWFDENFVARPPAGMWTRREIRFAARARGDLPDEKGYHRVALYEFTIRRGNGRSPMRGVMLVIPKHRLQDPPSRTLPIFDDRAENYTIRPSGTYHSFAWQSDEFVYVCFVLKGGDSLRTLQQAVAGPNA